MIELDQRASFSLQRVDENHVTDVLNWEISILVPGLKERKDERGPEP